MFNVAAFEIVDLVEVIISIFNIVGGVITIVCINYFGEALVILHGDIGSLDHLRVWRLLFDVGHAQKFLE